MSPQETRQTLIAKTISVIANEGLDKTTTKAITQGTGINEAYIYRNFKSKEDLLSKTFDELDEELVNKSLIFNTAVSSMKHPLPHKPALLNGCGLKAGDFKAWEIFY